MKRIFLFLLLATAAMADDDSPYFTGGLSNGRGWETSTADLRLMQVVGMREVAVIWEGQSPGTSCYVLATHGEVVKILNVFFDDPANANVPVVWALTYAKAKIEGRPPAELERFAANLRQSTTLLKNKFASKSSQ